VALLAFACISLAVAACGGGSSSSSGSSTSEETGGGQESETTSEETSGSGDLTPADIKWGAEWIKGKEGEADSSKEPFVIGWANQQGGTPDYTESTVGAEAAVKFINENLGGIDGRPVELKTCFIVAEEDGQKCGAEFLADKVEMVELGLAAVGNASLYKTVVPKLPVLVANPSAEADTTTPGVYSFTGGSISPIAADGILAAQVEGAKQSAVLYSTNPIGTFVATEILKPTLEKEGLGVSLVGVGDTATAPEVQSAIQASNAKGAQVFQMTTLPPTCIAAAEALEELSLEPKVVTTYQCSQPAVEEGLGEIPDNWIFTAYYEGPRVPNAKTGVNSYVGAVKSQGVEEKWIYNGDTAAGFAAVMMAARMAGEIGGETSPEKIAKEITAYHGPMMMVPGTAECGKVSKTFVGICGHEAPVQATENGEIKNLPPVDVTPFLEG
jgi:branched-chain amino acid transport system substrate-binding protein